MNISYCDLCGIPLKDENYFMLYISEPEKINHKTAEEYYDYLTKVRKEIKDICPTCKHVFNKMFELRLMRLSELTDEINNIYHLQSKKKNEKEKK